MRVAVLSCMKQRSVVLGNLLCVCMSLLSSCVGEVEGVPEPPDNGGSTPSTPDSGDPTPTPTSPSTLAKFNAWMKCMTFTDFQSAGMSPAWNNVITDNETTCETCHENGAEGFIATNNEQKFFDTIKANQYYALQYFAPQVGDPFKVLANEAAMQGVSKGQDPHREHPRFSAEPGLAASRDLAARVQFRFAAGNCP